MDSTTALSIYATLRMLNEELGLTTIIVSHDPTIARHVDRVVAIRDGMLASETRRQVRTVERFDEAALNSGGDGIVEEHEEHFEELVVLDSAGRLQIPKDVLQQFSIHGRAILDITDEGILIRPVENENAEARSLSPRNKRRPDVYNSPALSAASSVASAAKTVNSGQYTALIT